MGYVLVLFLVGLNIMLVTSVTAADKTVQQREWTDEYQYGAKKEGPKTGKPEEGDEFEVAPEK